MAPKIRYTAADKRLWTCDVCGKTETWGRSWASYGSLAADEECGHRVVSCSDACRTTEQAQTLVEQFERQHSWNARYGMRCKAASDT